MLPKYLVGKGTRNIEGVCNPILDLLGSVVGGSCESSMVSQGICDEVSKDFSVYNRPTHHSHASVARPIEEGILETLQVV